MSFLHRVTRRAEATDGSDGPTPPRAGRAERRAHRAEEAAAAERAARIARARRRLMHATGPLPVVEPRRSPEVRGATGTGHPGAALRSTGPADE